VEQLPLPRSCFRTRQPLVPSSITEGYFPRDSSAIQKNYETFDPDRSTLPTCPMGLGMLEIQTASRPRHPSSQVIFTTQRQVSTSTKWSEEDRTRIHILGINSCGMLYGHSLGNLQARPPLTYIVPSNWRVIQLASLNGEIEVIEGDDHYITGGFDFEAMERPPSSLFSSIHQESTCYSIP
jgi:hypothetical protein